MAAVAAERGSFELGARLLGAADRLVEETGAALGPFEHEIADRAAARAREALGDERLGSAWSEGRGMGLDEAADLALANVD
jgi:hypothetical protein